MEMSFGALKVVLILLALSQSPPKVNAQAKPGCDQKCGTMDVPYPFGTSSECYLNPDFFINCTNPSKPLLRKSKTVQVLSLSFKGELSISTHPSRDCYNSSGHRTSRNRQSLRVPKLFVSPTRNKFTTVGCDASGLIQGFTIGNYATGCTAMCYNVTDVVDGSCSGVGCCETPIPRRIRDYNLTVGSYFNHTYVVDFNPCSYAFVVEEGKFNFSASDLRAGEEKIMNMSFPVVLDWAVGDKTCGEVGGGNACVSVNSECYDSERGSGYRCKCKDGFDGNPYLSGGCQDVKECQNPELHECRDERSCIELEGGYDCSCWKNSTGCISSQHVWIRIIVGTSAGVTVILISLTWLYCGFKKWKTIKLKEKFFKQNGGLMLQQNTHQQEGSNETSLIFTEKELAKATNNYADAQIVGKGGYGTVFKGTLSDGRVVAIKKSKIVDQTQIEQFINEMLILSKINHRNVVKLLGFCLETQVPLLVYEFVANGTLFEHIHEKTKTCSLSWDVRLRVAAETAGVLAYLHSAASIPIIHRDIKTTNILLDEGYIAKVSDFGASRLVPLDQDELSTMVQGTLGYLDPEYLHTSQLTEKSDVYSFGIVLMELLTGQQALSFDRSEEKRSLAMYFLSALKNDGLFEILAESVRIEGEDELGRVEEVAKLARSCVRVKGEERPTMKEVAMELEGLRKVVKHPWNVESELVQCEDMTARLLEESFVDVNDYEVSSGGFSSAYDHSMRNHDVLPVHVAR